MKPGDMLTMVTDGVSHEPPLRASMNCRIESMANGILTSAYKGTDDALVLVARYRGTQP